MMNNNRMYYLDKFNVAIVALIIVVIATGIIYQENKPYRYLVWFKAYKDGDLLHEAYADAWRTYPITTIQSLQEVQQAIIDSNNKKIPGRYDNIFITGYTFVGRWY